MRPTLERERARDRGRTDGAQHLGRDEVGCGGSTQGAKGFLEGGGQIDQRTGPGNTATDDEEEDPEGSDVVPEERQVRWNGSGALAGKGHRSLAGAGCLAVFTKR